MTAVSRADFCLCLMLLGACVRTPAIAPTSSSGASMVRTADGAEIALVPAGEILMGSSDADPKAGDDEKPQHTVYLEAFWIDRTEVTNSQ